MDSNIILHLKQAGLSNNQIAIFEENEIETQDFLELSLEDLRILFPDKLGIVKKVNRIIDLIKIPANIKNELLTFDSDVGMKFDSVSVSTRNSISSSKNSEANNDLSQSQYSKELNQEMISVKRHTNNIATSQSSESPTNPPSKEDIKIQEDVISRILTISEVHQSLLISLINLQGSSLNKMSGLVHIIFPKWDSYESNQIKIKGFPSEVHRVIKEIQRKVEQFTRFERRSVEVDKTLHKYIIGRNGRTLQEILLKTKVFVDVPSRGSARNDIILRGLGKNLDEAEDMVLQKCCPRSTQSDNSTLDLISHIQGTLKSKK